MRPDLSIEEVQIIWNSFQNNILSFFDEYYGTKPYTTRTGFDTFLKVLRRRYRSKFLEFGQMDVYVEAYRQMRWEEEMFPYLSTIVGVRVTRVYLRKHIDKILREFRVTFFSLLIARQSYTLSDTQREV